MLREEEIAVQRMSASEGPDRCRPARSLRKSCFKSHCFTQSKRHPLSFLRFLPFEVGRGRLFGSGQCRAAMDMI